MSLCLILQEIDKSCNLQNCQEDILTATQTYCEECGYEISPKDWEEIRSRGLEDCYHTWLKIYVKDLWEAFGEVPMDPETETIESEWRYFPKGTHREIIWHWFEDTFPISVATDLMGLK